jgi:alkylation response protein AidB-like acyl-CoA dehydrogenase
VDLRDTPQEAVFRSDLRAWLAENLPPERDRRPSPRRWDPDTVRAWTAALHRSGYTGLTWPVEYGGRGLPVSFQAIFLEETGQADAPEHVGVMGLNVIGPTILDRGTAGQKRHYLPRILSGAVVFCQAFSEPEAGSDLAAVRTRAEPDGAGFVVTGHKIWSSYAHLADACLLLCRTGPAGADRHGLTCLLLDLRLPRGARAEPVSAGAEHPQRPAGVEVRPVRQLTGDADFNEILLDGVRVPADRVLGEVGDGWRVAMTGLAHERGTLGVTLAARLSVQLRRLVATARALGLAGDPVVRAAIADLAVDVAGLRWTAVRALPDARPGAGPGPESSVLKLSWSLAHQRMTSLALDLLAAQAVRTGAGAFWDGYWAHQHLRSLANTIEGGTSDILRSVIAERVLGLPRSR